MIISFSLAALLAAAPVRAAQPAPTVAQASAFIARAEATLEDLGAKDNFANWAYATYIIYDTEKLVAAADLAYAAETAKLAEEEA
mgnify:CR=1 FL=1